ncbi:protein dispatched homolog 1-like [Saccostrea echinata]|uniref:protein dispatched homolog 1-like n=1 Tax=Saccostrea echinata TaxID=191078 RepID=UPI002A82A70C|nr:protein dispatched homolog 1-like [Saccostrea echinata]
MEIQNEGTSEYSAYVKENDQLTNSKNDYDIGKYCEINDKDILGKTDSSRTVLGQKVKPPPRLEPLTKVPKKRKKRRYLKKLSSQVGIGTDPPSVVTRSTSSGEGAIKDQHEKDVSQTENSYKTFFYCRFIVKFPILAFLLSSTIHICAIVTTVSLFVSGDNVFPTDFKKLPLVLYDDSTRKQDLAWRSRDSYSLRITRPVYGIYYPTWVGGQVEDIVEVILQVDNGDIFSQSNLVLIQQTENLMYNFRDYKHTYCQRDEFFECVKPWSIIRLFDGTYNSINSKLNNFTFENSKEVLCNATKLDETKEFVEFIFPKGYDPCRSGSVSSVTRILLPMGYPLWGGNSKSRIKNFLVNKMKPNIEHIRDNILGDRIHLYYTSKMIFDNDVTKQAFDDMLFAIGSFLFIFLVMWIQTKSFFITFFGIFSILTSFLLANLVYRYVFNYEYFGFFHIISMFIILGIGADDVFVFYDSWRLTGDEEYPTLAHRLTDCYFRAAKTTFITSLTTMAAFLVSGTSPLLPVASFGLFTGVLVGVNYICDLIYFPTAIILYSEKIRPRTNKFYSWLSERCCFKALKCKVCKHETDLNENQSTTGSSTTSISYLCSPRRTAKEDISRLFPQKTHIHSRKKLNNLQESEIQKNSEEKEPTEQREKIRKEFEERMLVVRFLRHGFFSFMSLRVVRFVIPIIFLGVSSFFIYSATTLEPDSKQVQIFRSTHNHGRASYHHYYTFQRNFEGEYTSVFLAWGMLEKDTSTCSRKKSDFCSGTVVWDNTFDASSPEAQTAVYNLCQRLENASDSEINQLKIRRNAITSKPEVSCYLTAMETFLQEDVQKSGSFYPSDLNVDVPLDEVNMTKFMSSNPRIYGKQLALPKDYNRWLEIGLGYWITNRYTGRLHEDYFLYNHLIGEEYVAGETTIAQNTHLGLYYGSKLRYFGIQVNLTVSVFTLGYSEGGPLYRAWEQLMITEKAKMPPSLKNGFQCTRNTWHWIRVQEVLSDSAYLGIIIGLSVALPVLIITTMNFIIGFLAWVVIALVTVCVLGSIPLLGWKLGVLESLNLCMVVGLAVDYVVHLAEAYNMSPSINRKDKTRNMLEKMGLSVLSGAFTTFGASVFMLGAQIQFIYQFGIFVMITVFTSLFFSLFGFTSFLLILGPEGNSGSITALVKKICCCIHKFQSMPKDGKPSSTPFPSDVNPITIPNDLKDKVPK